MSLRLPFLIGIWTYIRSIKNLDLVQQVAKLCVGVVQDWITLELAIRIRNAKGYSDISEATKKKLRRTSGGLIVIIALSFVTFVVISIVSAHKQGNYGYSFLDNKFFVFEILGYCFLG